MDPDTLPLRDIHLPASITWWPPAPAWLIAAGLLAVIACASLFAWRRHVRLRAQRTALRELDHIIARYTASGDGHACARSLSRLTRRITLAYGGRDVTATTGREWLRVIQDLGGDEDLTESLIRILQTAPYSKAAAKQLQAKDYRAATAAMRTWLRALPNRMRTLMRSDRHAAV